MNLVRNLLAAPAQGTEFSDHHRHCHHHDSQTVPFDNGKTTSASPTSFSFPYRTLFVLWRNTYWTLFRNAAAHALYCCVIVGTSLIVYPTKVRECDHRYCRKIQFA